MSTIRNTHPTTHPTLYKQTSKGAVQQWTVSVKGNSVQTVYGLVGGKLQTTTDIVKEGKNIGRSNETTPEEQAALQAQQNYDAKLKEGYVTDKNLAASTKNTLEAVEPMLAHPIESKEKYVVFPGLAQPKLDGLRCVAVIRRGEVRLFSRTQKEYVTVPHITAEIRELFKDYLPSMINTTVLDGELYNHKFKKNFNKITSLIKREDVHPDHKLVEFHVYDFVDKGGYKERTACLDRLAGAKYLKRVETIEVKSREELEEYQGDCVSRGYEGCMYRNPSAPYEHKRSSGLLKVKTFQDAEFKIVDVEEGAGKLMGRVGAFFCDLGDGTGRTFKAKPMGTLEAVKEYWERKGECLGKMATVKYQNLTPDGVPRFPVLKCIRDYE